MKTKPQHVPSKTNVSSDYDCTLEVMKSDGEWGSTIPGNEDCIKEFQMKKERIRKLTEEHYKENSCTAANLGIDCNK